MFRVIGLMFSAFTVRGLGFRVYKFRVLGSSLSGSFRAFLETDSRGVPAGGSDKGSCERFSKGAF